MLREIQRVLKPGGWLFAPTFVHGGGRLARLRTWCMERTGFHVYHRWNAGEFVSYLSMHDFWVVEHALLGGRVLPPLLRRLPVDTGGTDHRAEQE